MKVCIAEKPSVAKEIAYIIGAKSRQDGYFEGNGYCVTWTFGHLCTLKLPDDYQDTWKKWSLHSLPMLPEKFETKLISNKGVKKQFGVIKKLFKKAKVVINCGDAGQEGELIQRWVMNQAKYKGPVQRLWISSLTAEAIREGFQNLRNASQYDNLYHAGFSRAIGDWLLGMNATRLYTLKYGGYKQVLSIGRVQTPTLALLVKRFKEIENFVPHPYWELHTFYREVDFHYVKGRFLKKEEGEQVLQQVKGHPFVITDFKKKKGKEYPPRLFDLTSLQVHCNKRFGYSAEQTLKIAQKLYEQKIITYPRVDTTYLPNDQYPKIVGILKKMTAYSQFTAPLLGKPIRKSPKVFNDKKVTDHHAIIPTGMEKSLPIQEKNVYDSIGRRFIAAFYPDCIVSNTTVLGAANKVSFKATGKEIVDPGWRVLFPKAKKKNTPTNGKQKKNEVEEKILPVFKVGETGPHTPSLLEKMTQAPKHYTEATLLRAMETAGKMVEDEGLRDLMKANGIGRPSTRANIIETLFRREYMRRQKKLIIATETGVQLIDIIQNELLKSPELTGQWEKQLRDIENGSHSAKQFIGDMQTMVKKLTEEVRYASNTTRITSTKASSRPRPFATTSTKKKPSVSKKSLTEQICPKCKAGKLLKGKAAYGCSQYKTGCSFRLPFSFKGKDIPELQLLRLVQHGATIQLRGFQENGKKLTGKLSFNEQFDLQFSPKTAKQKVPFKKKKAKPASKKAPDQLTCPKCGIGKVIKGKTAYGCSHWKTGCTFRFDFAEVRRQANGKALTRELVYQILCKDTL